MSKLKTYEIYWTAEVRGKQTVQAFDEEDAMDQFDSNPNMSDVDQDERFNAEADEIVLVKKTKKAK
jgi:hypothetical protein